MGNGVCNYASNEFEDAQVLAHLPGYNLYQAYIRMGVFIHRKKEGLEFKQILQELLDFAKIQYVSYLYLLSLAYDHDHTRQLQQRYQRVLSRKLSFNVRALKVNTGDQALQKLEHLFAKFMSISMRMASDISHDVQRHWSWVCQEYLISPTFSVIAQIEIPRYWCDVKFL